MWPLKAYVLMIHHSMREREALSIMHLEQFLHNWVGLETLRSPIGITPGRLGCDSQILMGSTVVDS